MGCVPLCGVTYTGLECSIRAPCLIQLISSVAIAFLRHTELVSCHEVIWPSTSLTQMQASNVDLCMAISLASGIYISHSIVKDNLPGVPN